MMRMALLAAMFTLVAEPSSAEVLTTECTSTSGRSVYTLSFDLTANKGLIRVLSDECELVSVWHECGDIMQHQVDATRREQRCVEV
jgi:hypothetical protein